jgi:Sel1 repeat-containing protein
MEMSEGAKQYHYTVTYERQDALDASSFFMGTNEQGRGGWRAAIGLFGILLFAMGLAFSFIPPGKVAVSGQAHLTTFIIAAVFLSWSVDPAFRDFTRRLWLPRGRALIADFSDAGVTIQRNVHGSKFTAWSDVTSVTERADGILLVFKDKAAPVPGMDSLYRHLTWMIGSPILWLPTRTFVGYEAKWEFRDFAHQFVPESTNGDTSFFRIHIATLAVIALLVTTIIGTPAVISTIRETEYRKGVKYLTGDGVAQDDVQGAIWIAKAAKGLPLAQYELGVLYLQGQGMLKNEQTAVAWIQKAAEAGLPIAQEHLGNLNEGGIGMQKNGIRAEYWYRKAAAVGYAPAQNSLGGLYEYGIANYGGRPKEDTRDERQAAYWYGQAAQKGLAEAQDNLGNLYMTGRGVPNDQKLAEYWFRKATAQGYAHAKINLNVLLGNVGQ